MPQYHVHVLVDGRQVRDYFTDFGPDFPAQATIDGVITDYAAREGKQWRIDIYDPVENYTYILASDAVSPRSMPVNLSDWTERRS